MTFSFIFTEQELQIIGQALAQGPYAVVAPLIAKLNQTIAEQQKEEMKDA